MSNIIDKCQNGSCEERCVAFSRFCWEHHPAKQEYSRLVEQAVARNESLAGVNLKGVTLAGADLKGVDLKGASLNRADLSGANLFDAKLENAELLGTCLNGADLTGGYLKGADLSRSDLRGAKLWHADLTSVNLVEADLSGADLWDARLFDVRMWRTNIQSALSISRKSFRGYDTKNRKGERINESGLSSAEEAYRILKNYFSATGQYDDASWAAFKEKRIERLQLWRNRSPKYIPSLIMAGLCGYGEKPQRIIASSFFAILVYALAYRSLETVQLSADPGYALRTWDYLYFSMITFTTVGYGDFIPRSVTVFRLLSASEAFLGAFMIGLFVFTLARRYTAR